LSFKVSSKKLLADLDSWYTTLAGLLRGFVGEGNARRKFEVWSAITDPVSAALGGRLPIEENLCACAACAADLAALQIAARGAGSSHDAHAS
jgi:hypothetical protein